MLLDLRIGKVMLYNAHNLKTGKQKKIKIGFILWQLYL